MVKLNYELTEELMTKCNTLDELKAMHERGVNFMECSRLAIDDALSRFFKKKCNFNKEKAVEMMVALINGQEVSEESNTDEYKVHHEDNSPSNLMNPELRMQKIKDRLDAIVNNKKGYCEYARKVIRDPEMKLLGATEEDVKEASKTSQVAVCCLSFKHNKYYVMERIEENIKSVIEGGDTVY